MFSYLGDVLTACQIVASFRLAFRRDGLLITNKDTIRASRLRSPKLLIETFALLPVDLAVIAIDETWWGIARLNRVIHLFLTKLDDESARLHWLGIGERHRHGTAGFHIYTHASLHTYIRTCMHSGLETDDERVAHALGRLSLFRACNAA